MPNRYCNIDGSRDICDEYSKINTGFQAVQEDVDDKNTNLLNQINADKAALESHKLSTDHPDINIPYTGNKIPAASNMRQAADITYERVNNILNNPSGGKDLELVDAHWSPVKDKTFDNVGERMTEMEGDINSFKKPQYSTSQSVIAPVWGVTNAAMEAPFKEFLLKGRTITQVLNYNTDTFDNWNITAGSKDSTGIILTGYGVELPCNFKPNTKYGFLCYLVSKDTGNLNNAADAFADYSVSGLLSQSVGFNKLVLTTLNSITYNRLYWFSTDGTPVKFRDVRCFELPLGSQIESDFNTLTASQLAEKYQFVNGTSGTNPLEIKSVSKNRLKLLNTYKKNNGNPHQGSLLLNEGIIDVSNFRNTAGDSSFFLSDSIRVSRGTTLYIYFDTIAEFTGQYAIYMSEYDELGNITATPNLYDHTGTRLTSLVLNTNTTYVVLTYYSSVVFLAATGKVRFAISNEPITAYEPYKPSIIYTPELNNVTDSNGNVLTEDTFDAVSGEAVKNCGKDTTLIKNATGWSQVYETINTIGFRAKDIIFDALNINNSSVSRLVCGSIDIPLRDAVTVWGTDIEGHSISLDNFVMIRVNKSRLTTLDVEGFIAFLQTNPPTFIYKLAQPIVTQHESGLMSFPSGTISITPRIKFDAKPVGGVITVPQKYQQWGIKAVASCKKIVDGIPSDDATVSSFTAITITPANADNTSIYEVIYNYDGSTIPETTYSFAINRGAQADQTAKQANETSMTLSKFIAYQNAVNLQFDLRITALE